MGELRVARLGREPQPDPGADTAGASGAATGRRASATRNTTTAPPLAIQSGTASPCRPASAPAAIGAAKPPNISPQSVVKPIAEPIRWRGTLSDGTSTIQM